MFVVQSNLCLIKNPFFSILCSPLFQSRLHLLKEGGFLLIRECPVCQKSRVTVKEKLDSDYHVIEAYAPFEEISVDFMTSLPPDEFKN